MSRIVQRNHHLDLQIQVPNISGCVFQNMEPALKPMTYLSLPLPKQIMASPFTPHYDPGLIPHYLRTSVHLMKEISSRFRIDRMNYSPPPRIDSEYILLQDVHCCRQVLIRRVYTTNFMWIDLSMTIKLITLMELDHQCTTEVTIVTGL